MRQMEIDRVLKDLYISNINLHQNGIELTEPMVYHYLTKLGLPDSERSKRINNYFQDWIETFKNFPNIKVFNSQEWKYFCQFTNREVEPDCIKMYISLDSTHICQGAKIIFDFLEKNNITHKSKIGSDVRTDDIVIRLTNEYDAKRLSEYINKSNYIKEGMLKVNPFCFESNGIGYAYDGHLSYNSCVAQLITDYSNRMYELGINQNEVNINSFYKYVEAYLQIPEKINSLPHVEGDSEKLLEASLVLELVKYSLGTSNIEDFFKFYNYAINKKKESYNSTKNVQEDKEELFNEVILTTMKKYHKGYNPNEPERDGFNYLEHFLNGNLNGITRDKNLRTRVQNNLSLEDTLMIAKQNNIPGNTNIDIVLNYIKTTILNEIIKCCEIRNPGYGILQVQEYLNSGSLKFITEGVANARTLAKNLDPNMIHNLFINLGVQNIEEYVKYYYNNKNKSIQK